MTSRLTASVVLAILMAIPPLGVDGYEPPRIRSVADLRAAMYPVVGHWPCVLLLNATGSVGCSTREPVWATLQRCEDMGCVRSIGGDRTLLLPPAVFPRAMREYLDGTDPVTEGWRGRVKGMFVEVGDGAEINATELAGASFSPQPAYPQAELRPSRRSRHAPVEPARIRSNRSTIRKLPRRPAGRGRDGPREDVRVA